MECAYAEHLRNVALVSISRELRARNKRRSAAFAANGQTAGNPQELALLRQETDEQRKALRIHLADCRRCQPAQTEAMPYLLPKSSLRS
jgi:hypothetical protein